MQVALQVGDGSLIWYPLGYASRKQSLTYTEIAFVGLPYQGIRFSRPCWKHVNLPRSLP